MQPHRTVIYQVDPYLFRDSTGHGWGTLDGIAEKLDYLQWLGVSHLWLLPFFRSAGRDGGYDVLDHCAIDPRLGDEASFARLVRAARERGIGIIVELVMQHTSELHPWFQAARAGDAEMQGRYIWTDAPAAIGPAPMFPPVQPGVWSWDPFVRRYYRHMFYAHEPDLECGNPAVRREMGRIMAHWLDRGACGFRIDAVPYMVERACLAVPEEGGRWLLNELSRHVAGQLDEPVLIGEADVPAAEYGNYVAGGRLSHLLDFHLNNHLFLALAREDAGEITRTLAEYGDTALATTRIAWLRNNDELDLEQLTPDERGEVMDRFAPEPWMRIYGRGIRRRLAPMLDGDRDALAMAHALLLSLGQVPVLRYGDEIGLGDDLDLPERNAVRVPMQWHAGAGAGFCDHPAHAWRRPQRDGRFGYAHCNVAAQRGQPSLLEDVRALLQVRRDLPALSAAPQACAFAPSQLLALRFAGSDQDVVALVNLSARPLRLERQALGTGDFALARHVRCADDTVEIGGYGYGWYLRDQAPASDGST
ncbi:alpha-amylase family glycosyl hydrolase [[Pseudomonas] boreopolis]|uniref:alpha-amylase family glycosyl hydrolase n=1 Tax=Xanthomonas boreopolis TaxID=86183 RepID=UPI003DA0EE0D